MGDRGNIAIQYEEDGEQGRWGTIYLYSHWGGSYLKATLASALNRGRSRWDDESYLARIIFSEMIADDLMGTTGYGIAPYQQDLNHPTIVVNIKDRIVDGVPFDAFVDNNMED